MKPEKLRKWREEMNLSRTAAAEALGCHRNSMINWEKSDSDGAPLYIEYACNWITLLRRGPSSAVETTL